MTERVAIAGDGQMGLVLAEIAREGGHQVRIWSPIEDDGVSLARLRTSERLPGFSLHGSIAVETDPRAAFEGATVLLSAIPVQYLRTVCGRISGCVPAGCLIGSASKGMEVATLAAPTRVIAESLTFAGGARVSQSDVVVVSGPNIAAEIARGLPALMVAASRSPLPAERLKSVLTLPRLRIYLSNDPLGVEFAGAAKNVIALAAGLLDGMGVGINAKSALLARGLAEIVRLGSALGADASTFHGIAGVGDLATTCFSPEGRNRSCGEALGRGVSLQEYCAASKCVVEGVETCRAIVSMAQQRKVEMPIAQAVHEVLFDSLPPREALARLMARVSSSER